MSCFRACDIRGVYPAEVNEDLFRRIGQAVGRRWASSVDVLVGHDCRTGSPSLHAALITGLLEGGAHAVLDAGRVPTPLIYHGKRTLGIPIAISVTASHNPPEYHGLKLLLAGGPAQPPDIAWLEANSRHDSGSRGTGLHTVVDLVTGYAEFLRSQWKDWRVKRPHGFPIRVIADCGNGAWSGLAPVLLASLGFECTAINDTPDGRFPGRSPDCANPANLSELAQRVTLSRAQIGLAWDGDGDRLAVIDDEGHPVTADRVALLLLPSLSLRANDSVLVDVKISRVVQQQIVARGLHPVVERSAHCSLERTMRQQRCAFGCEYSGHYFFRELEGADDGLYAALHLCGAVASSGSLSQMVRALPPIFITPDIRLAATRAECDRVIDRVEHSFPGAAVSRFDGVSIDLGDASFLVRPSVSEDKLSLRVEGNSAESFSRTVSIVADLFPEPLRASILLTANRARAALT